MAGLWAGTCGAFGFLLAMRATRMAVAARALANDLDSPRRPRCGQWHLNLKLIPEISRDFMGKWYRTTRSASGLASPHVYQAGHQYNASIPPNVKSQCPRPHDHTKQKPTNPFHLCIFGHLFVQQFAFGVRTLENAEPIAAQRIFFSPSSRAQAPVTQEYKNYRNSRVEDGKCEPRGFGSSLRGCIIYIVSFPNSNSPDPSQSSPGFFFTLPSPTPLGNSPD